MPLNIKINVTADLSPALNPLRYLDKNRPIILKTAAERYLRYLKERFIRLSRGGGEWSPLEESTIASKKSRGSPTPRTILREFSDLFNSMGMRIGRNTWYVGFVTNFGISRPSDRASGTISLAKLHTKGGGRNKIRRVIGLPSEHVRRAMLEDIRKEYKKIQDRFRKR